jgi:multidrug efflux pump subunit AcrA (membrane-fusion protein)
VNPAVQADTRSGKVRIRVTNRGAKLKAGMFAQGQILTDSQRQAILIPSDAAYRDDRSSNTAFVFVIANGRAARRNVIIGGEHDTMLEIVAGLNAGDIVASEQSIELADGVLVEPAVPGGR